MIREFDTIAAHATQVGGGISIIRLSGTQSVAIIKRIFTPKNKEGGFKSHRIYYGEIKDGAAVIDEVMVSFMLAPKSYTKEDVVEVNCHGGATVTKMVLELILKNGARLAEPGEFTKRAFLNGRIDLTKAEAVIDIINAKTEKSHQSAVERLKGRLSEKIKAYGEEILLLIANIEASIDYPEHEMEHGNIQDISVKVCGIINKIDDLIKNSDKGILLKEGVKTAIIGRPNVGKSSLLNEILNEERAIVTDMPGTTRDVVSEHVNVLGIPLKIMDTAGIRETNDRAEKIGVEKSLEVSKTAGLNLIVLDSAEELTDTDKKILKDTKDRPRIIILNKSDLPQKADRSVIKQLAEDAPFIEISAKKSFGLENLYNTIYHMFMAGETEEEEILIGSMRNKASLLNAKQSLINAAEGAEAGIPEDLISIDLTDAYRYLKEITGETVSEDIIDKIFSEFCLGK